MKKSENRKMQNTVYYYYFTEYLLFSNQYEKLLEEGLLDVDIQNGYLQWLCYFVDDMLSKNIYPISIVERLYTFASLLENYVKDEVEKEILHWIKEAISNQNWKDEMEVYNREYDSRYATVASAKDFDAISVHQLRLDIQKDFQYLNTLFMSDKEAKMYIDEDFPFFLNKLLLDYPQVIQDRRIQSKIIRILKESNFANKEKYIHLFQDKTNYAMPQGFDLIRVENFYSFTILKKMLASKDIKKELDEVPRGYVYHNSFILAIQSFIEQIEIDADIIKRERDNLREILLYMRQHLKDTPLYDRAEIVAVINKGLHLINILQPIEDIVFYTKEYMRRIGKGFYYLFLSSFRKEEVKEYLDFLIAFTPQVFAYLLGKIEEEQMMTRLPIYEEEIGTNYNHKDIVVVLNYLFSNYPRMFFDDIIYRRTENLLDGIPPKEKRKVCKNIARIRKDFD